MEEVVFRVNGFYVDTSSSRFCVAHNFLYEKLQPK